MRSSNSEEVTLPCLCNGRNGDPCGTNGTLKDARTSVGMNQTEPLCILNDCTGGQRLYQARPARRTYSATRHGLSRSHQGSCTKWYSLSRLTTIRDTSNQTSAFPRISTPSASLREFIRTKGVFPARHCELGHEIKQQVAHQ